MLLIDDRIEERIMKEYREEIYSILEEAGNPSMDRNKAILVLPKYLWERERRDSAIEVCRMLKISIPEFIRERRCDIHTSIYDKNEKNHN